MTNQHQSANGFHASPPPAVDEAALSAHDLFRMIGRHGQGIIGFVLVITVAAAAFFLFQPRLYRAEGLLQVIPRTTGAEDRIDKDLFETTIMSHLQKVQSASVAKHTAEAVSARGFPTTEAYLLKEVRINRPAKTDLIRIVGGAPDPDMAVTVVRHWIQGYLDSVQKNNLTIALYQIRAQLKKNQSAIMELQGGVEALKAQANRTAPVIDLVRSVDDVQVWKEIADKPTSDSLKRLAGISIKGQEPSMDYVTLKTMQWTADQNLGAAQAYRQFYQDVEALLESQFNGTSQPPTPHRMPEAVQYVSTILKASDIVTFGEPALLTSSRGAGLKIGLVFISMLILACLTAFLYEWGRELA